MSTYIVLKGINYLGKVSFIKAFEKTEKVNVGVAYNEMLRENRRIKTDRIISYITHSIIEVSYTGGGVWLAEKDRQDGTYAVIDNDFIDCLTIYKNSNEEEKYTAENMIFSAAVADLNEELKNLYNELFTALNAELEKWKK